MKVIDPHAVVTFDTEVIKRLTKELGKVFDEVAGKGRVKVKVSFAHVDEQLALQYAYEGSCGPSSLALILSMLRAAKKVDTSRPLPPAFPAFVFQEVKEEEVVLAVQLLHNAVV